ncbi:MAG: hypothetical protein Q8P67_27845 [archaeon]|nr:hypothetical protein [archaeon]
MPHTRCLHETRIDQLLTAASLEEYLHQDETAITTELRQKAHLHEERFEDEQLLEELLPPTFLVGEKTRKTRKEKRKREKKDSQ